MSRQVKEVLATNVAQIIEAIKEFAPQVTRTEVRVYQFPENDPRDQEIREARQKQYALEDKLMATNDSLCKAREAYDLLEAMVKRIETPTLHASAVYLKLMRQWAHSDDPNEVTHRILRKARKMGERPLRGSAPKQTLSAKNEELLPMEQEAARRLKRLRDDDIFENETRVKLRKLDDCPYMLRAYTK